MRKTGKVYLVGAGPGDPDLLTLKAHDLLQSADVVIYDRLISDQIMEMVRPGIPRIPVGKANGCHSVPQEEINLLLTKLAATGRTVVRLKGGDSFIFGRGSEEALHLHRHGIEYEVVPGVTAAVACSAYAGVPLTHRGVSRGVRLVTGHFKENETVELDWRSLADPEATLAIYMGLANLKELATRLIDEGLPHRTPAMAIQSGTLPTQQVVTGTLQTLPEQVEDAGLSSPVLILIGETVALAEELAWFNPARKQAEIHARTNDHL